VPESSTLIVLFVPEIEMALLEKPSTTPLSLILTILFVPKREIAVLLKLIPTMPPVILTTLLAGLVLEEKIVIVLTLPLLMLTILFVLPVLRVTLPMLPPLMSILLLLQLPIVPVPMLISDIQPLSTITSLLLPIEIMLLTADVLLLIITRL
jgi:hypothetical protein